MKKIVQLFFAVSLMFTCSLHATNVTINPIKDGFVQQSGDSYVDNFQNMNLKNQSSFNREIFLDYNLTGVAFTPKYATLKIYVNSIDNSTPFIVSVYSKTGNAIVEGFKFSTRPVTGQYKTADIHATQDSVGKWLIFDFSDFISAQDFSVNKLLYFRIVITAPATSPLITIGSIESANKPQLVLSDVPMPVVSEIPYAEIESFFSSAGFASAGNPIYAFNGAGLLPGMKHVTAGDNMVWRNSDSSYPIKLMAKLKKPSHISRLHVWNMNWLFGTESVDYTGRGVKNVDIYVSSSMDDLTLVDFSDSRWVKVTSDGFELTRATGSLTYGGEIVNISGADNTRWLAFNVLSNFESTTYVGLSEVKIYKSAIPEQYSWTGSSGDSWTDATKWLPNRLSIYSSDILNFTGSGTQTIMNVPAQTLDRLKVQSGKFIFKNSGTLNLTNLEVQAGAGAEFAPDASATVDVSENITVGAAAQFTNRVNNSVNVQNIYLNSNSSGTGTLLNEGALQVQGNSIVQQYLSTKTGETKKDHWWYFSSPVSNATSAGILVDGSSNKLGYYNESSASYPQITSTATQLQAGKGYLAQINTSGTYTFSGSLNDGVIPVSVSRTVAAGVKRGFNLIGNPYPSFIDWNAITGFGSQSPRTDIRSSIWYRTRTASGDEMTFDTFDGEDGTANGKNGEVSQYIPPLQAFWVKVHADGTAPEIEFTNSIRSHQDQSSSLNRLRIPEISNRQLLRLKLSNGINSDETIISTNENAGDDYELLDTEKLSANSADIPEIYSLIGNQEIVINKMRRIEAGKNVQLGIRPGKQGSFTISVTELRNLEDVLVVLKDNQINHETILDSQSNYTFTSDANLSDSRFSIEFRARDAATSTNDKRLQNSISVGKDNRIIIYSNQLNNQGKAEVFDMTGQLIVSQLIYDPYTVIGKSMKPGVYLVKVSEFVQKVVIN